jgi:hypothetical protein
MGTTPPLGTMSMTHPNWVAPPTEITSVGKPFKNDLGFRNPIPVDLDVHTYGQYFGTNESALGLPKTLYFSHQPEYFARGGYLPTIQGRPLINPHLPMYNFSRDDYAQRFSL